MIKFILVGDLGNLPPLSLIERLLRQLVTRFELGAGKRSIYQRFLQDTFSPNHHLQGPYLTFETKTINVRPTFNVKTFLLLAYLAAIDYLAVWNTGGTESFGRLTGLHYKGARGILVVYDITDLASFENVTNRWIVELRSSGAINSPLPFLLGAFRLTNSISWCCLWWLKGKLSLIDAVGTKSDLQRSRVVTPEEGKKLAHAIGAIGWTEVSSVTGSGGSFLLIPVGDLDRFSKKIHKTTVTEAFLTLAKFALDSMDPFNSRLCEGYHIPSEAVLRRIHNLTEEDNQE